MADGRAVVLKAGEFFYVPPGHDSWVVGDEPYVSLHIMGSERYPAPMRGEDVSVDPNRDLDETGPGAPAQTEPSPGRQIGFYDDPGLISPSADALAAWFDPDEAKQSRKEKL